MTGTKVTLVLRAQSREGIHDFIPILEEVIEDIKGGFEWREVKKSYKWNIDTVK